MPHHMRMKEVMGLLNFLNMFSRAPSVPAPRRLDGRSRALLAASFRPLRDGESGWISVQEAGRLFSAVEDNDAFGEMDKLGHANLAAFTSALGEAQSEFAAGRLNLMRKAAHGFVTPCGAGTQPPPVGRLTLLLGSVPRVRLCREVESAAQRLSLHFRPRQTQR
jgi:hypothetical protein